MSQKVEKVQKGGEGGEGVSDRIKKSTIQEGGRPYFAKLSPSPSSIGAELALFSADPTTHPHLHPPGKVFLSSS